MAASLQELFDRLDAIQGEGDALEKAMLVEGTLDTLGHEYGRESREYAAALNELGTCYRAAANYEQAAVHFKDAVGVLERVTGSGSPDYAMALMNYAGVVRLVGQLDESLELFEQAKHLFAATLGETSLEYLTALNNEALCYQDKGEYQEALGRHVQVCSALERQGEPSVAYATSLYNTGFCLKQISEEDLGDELVRRSIEVYRQLLPDGHELLEHAKAVLGEYEPPRP